MARTENIEVQGIVVKALPNAMFKVEADVGEVKQEGKHEVLCTVAGKMRKYYIRILPGDQVTVILSPYDLHRGRIIYRKR